MHATDPHSARALAQARPTITCIHLVHDVCRGCVESVDWTTGMEHWNGLNCYKSLFVI